LPAKVVFFLWFLPQKYARCRHLALARIFPLHPAIVFVVVVVIPVSATEFQVRIAFCFCRICGFVVLSDGVKWSGSPENGEGNW